VEAGDTVILILPEYEHLIWEHIPIVDLTDGVTASLITALATLPTQPILMVVMVMAEDSVGAEDSAEEDGGKPR
jgi:hypothetical protein